MKVKTIQQREAGKYNIKKYYNDDDDNDKRYTYV